MLPRIDGVIERVREYNPSSSERLLQKAYLFSAKAHKGQQRYNGEPYLVHPVAVADILAGLRADDIAIIAGLLHDVVEDNEDVSLDEIDRLFGKATAHIVDGVTKIDKHFPEKSRVEREWHAMRKVVLAMVDDVRVILVKLADRLHNLRTMDALPEHRRPVKALQTLEVYAPIAHRLGLGAMKSELEDLGFKYAYPDEFERLSRALKEKRSYSNSFAEETAGELKELLKELKTQGEIRWRIKHPYSIYVKLQRQGIGVEEVYDYMGFRIIVESVKDCYTVLGGIHGRLKPIPGRFRDFIALPKENHYRSLHTSVIGLHGHPFEIQIRTREMDEEAERGIAAHWRYKEGRMSSEDEARNTAWIRQLVEFKQDEASGGEFIHNLRVNLYPNEVYVFTPRGDVLSFPRGATPIDFAYSIHTDVGHHCIGAKINGKLETLKTVMKSGDRVEIITSANGKPSRDWLKIAVTNRALSKIRGWLNAREKARAIEIGRAALEKEFKRCKLNFKSLMKDGGLEEAMKRVSIQDMDSLQAAVGYGKISARNFAKRLQPQIEEEPPQTAKTRAEGAREPAVVVRGATDLLTTIAKCCKPIPGDEVIGFISRGRGLVIHRADCHSIRQASYNQDRFMEVEWAAPALPSADSEVHLLVVTEDKTGMVANITKIVADVKAPLRFINATVEKDEGNIRLDILVRDREHLNEVINKIAKIPGVKSLRRLNR